jgi:hypothetical protein
MLELYRRETKDGLTGDGSMKVYIVTKITSINEEWEILRVFGDKDAAAEHAVFLGGNETYIWTHYDVEEREVE